MSDPQSHQLLRVWWNVSAMLVVLMQLGFIFLEMGCVRRHNRTGIAVKNFMIFITSCLAYSVIGFYIMFGLQGSDSVLENSPGWLFYQAGFAAVAATIISGALAGRTTLISNVIVAGVICLIVYPIYGSWVWGGGWLDTKLRDVHDFAGSGVVHFVGGTAAAVGAWITGPRDGWRTEGSQSRHPWPRDLRYATIGVVFLWIGWIGFNGGSVSPDHVERTGFRAIGSAVLATSVAASAGGFTALAFYALGGWLTARGERKLTFTEAFRKKLLFDPFAVLTGTMGGMVCVTASCDLLFHSPTGYLLAIPIGIAGSAAALLVSLGVGKLGLDDPVDAVAVHAGGGAMGIIVCAFIGGDTSITLSVQLLGLFAALVLVVPVMSVTFLVLKKSGILRCSVEEEHTGLRFDLADSPVFLD